MRSVSIITATWNRGDLLHIPIESVLAQTYENWDLWIIDDASNDNTKEVVKSYKDKRIHYFRLPKRVYYTIVRNVGIKKSKGELLAFRDSDGAWDKTFLEEMVKPHINEDVLMTYCGRFVYEDVNLSKIKYEDIKYLQPKKILEPIPYRGPESLSNYIDVGDMLIKRKVFHDKFDGFFEGIDVPGYCSDARLCDDIEKANPTGRFIMVKKPLHFYFYKHDGKTENMTTTKLNYRKEGKVDNELETIWKF